MNEWSLDYDVHEAYSIMTDLPSDRADSKQVQLTSFNTNSYPPLQRLVHHLFTTIITPQGGGRGRLIETQRLLFYCLFRNIKVSLPNLIFHFLFECIDDHRHWPFTA